MFSKLNDLYNINGIVDLSHYTLTKSETSFIKRAGFLPHSRGTRHWEYYPGSGCFQKKNKIKLFVESNQDPPEQNTQSGVPFEHKSFKLKSTFNPVGPFPLETMFHSIEQDWHRLKYRQPKKEKLI